MASTSYGSVQSGLTARPPSAGSRDRTLGYVRAITCVTALAEGYDIAVINGALTPITEEFQLLTWQVSVLVSVFMLSSAVGAIIASWIADSLGRKTSLAFCYGVLVLGSIVVAFSPSFWVMIAGRIAMGMSTGAGFVCVALYTCEVVPADRRGFYISLEGIFLNIGLLLAFTANWGMTHASIESNLRWRVLMGVCAILPFFCSIALLTSLFPHSARWLRMQGRDEEAKRAILMTCDEEEARQMWESSSGRGSHASWGDVLFPKTSAKRRALVASVGTACFQLLTGIHLVTVYSGYILSREMSHQDATWGSMCFGVSKLIVLCAASLLVDRIGRRKMLLASSLCLCASWSIFAWAFAMASGGWVKVAILCCVTASFSLGYGSAAYVVISEALTNEYRAKASGLAFAISRLAGTVLAAGFPFADKAFGLVPCFLAVASVCALSFMFTWFCVPETMRYRLEDMHLAFEHKEESPSLKA